LEWVSRADRESTVFTWVISYRSLYLVFQDASNPELSQFINDSRASNGGVICFEYHTGLGDDEALVREAASLQAISEFFV
jgi:hypothetical protein